MVSSLEASLDSSLDDTDRLIIKDNGDVHTEIKETLYTHPRAKTRAWHHFGFPKDADGKLLMKKVVCRECRDSFPYSGNMTNLYYYLRKEHPSIYEEVEPDNSKKELTESPSPYGKHSKQLTIEGAFANCVPYSRDSPKQKKIVEATTMFICQAMMPLSLVDEPSFRHLLTADPRIDLPHCTHFSTKLLPKHYQLIRLEVEKEISCATYITITSDLWTAQHQHRAYIPLTVHFIDASFQMRSRCLQTLEILQDHSADSISEVLSEMLIDWKIKERVIGATTDNAKNIINAIEQMDIQHLPCVGHTLQLAVKHGLEIAKVKSCVSWCKSVVSTSHFKKSTKDTYSLRDKQAMLQLPCHELIQDCVTRWGSTLAMLERLMEQ